MYKVLLTTDDPEALLATVSKQRHYQVIDPVMLKNTVTEQIAGCHISDFERHPFRMFFRVVAKLLVGLLVGLSLFYMLGVFTFGMVVAFAHFHLVGLALTGLSLGILLAYGYMAGRRPAV
jgi:hypothetical protein